MAIKGYSTFLEALHEMAVIFRLLVGWGLIPLQRCNRNILQSRPTGLACFENVLSLVQENSQLNAETPSTGSKTQCGLEREVDE